MQLVDTHCHLYTPPLADDVPGVLQRARDAGVGLLVVPGVDGPTSEEACRLAAAHPAMVRAAIGWHPQLEDTADPDLGLLERLARRPGVVAVGEIGLDGEIGPPREVQERRLRLQLAFARAHGLPVLLHCRTWFAPMAALLREEWQDGPGGVLHAWPGSLELYRSLEPLGLCLGVAGVASWPVARHNRAMVAAAPLERIVLETDSPYIGTATRPRGSVEPADLREVLRAVAELHGRPEEEVARITRSNALRMLRLPDPAIG